MEVVEEVEDKDHTKDHRDLEEEDQDPEDQTGTGVDHQDQQHMLVLHPALTMTTPLLQASVQVQGMVLLVVLGMITELLAVQTHPTPLLQELVQGTRHLQDQGQDILLLTRHTQGFSLAGRELGGGGEGGTGSRVDPAK